MTSEHEADEREALARSEFEPGRDWCVCGEQTDDMDQHAIRAALEAAQAFRE